MAGMPGLYFHSLFGSRGDRAGADASGIPRRINRQKVARPSLEAELADPTSLRALVWTGLRKLLSARRSNCAFHPCGRQEIRSIHSRLFAVERTAPDRQGQVLCIHNISQELVETRVKWGSPIFSRHWRRLAGSGDMFAESGNHFTARLAPYEFIWVGDQVT